jgi:hypothetical protein
LRRASFRALSICRSIEFSSLRSWAENSLSVFGRSPPADFLRAAFFFFLPPFFLAAFFRPAFFREAFFFAPPRFAGAFLFAAFFLADFFAAITAPP